MFRSIHIIVDGYNFIRRSPQLSELDRQDMELGREALLEILAAYKKARRHRITVVFDGQGTVSNQDRHAQVRGIRIVFSRSGRSADDVIKKMASHEGEKALIVSSDNEVRGFCTARGASAIHSEAFERSVYEAVYALGGGGDRVVGSENRKAGTQKKGPSRRLSKKERRHRRKVERL